MPTQKKAEENFLNAMRSYVDFRLSTGVETPARHFGDTLVSTFTEFLDSRPVKGRPDTVKFLIKKMSRMKESRGGGSPKPGPQL